MVSGPHGVVPARCRVSTTPCQHDEKSKRWRANTMCCQDDTVPRRHRVNTPPCQKAILTIRCLLEVVSSQDDVVSETAPRQKQCRVKSAYGQDDIVSKLHSGKMMPRQNGFVTARCRAKATSCQCDVMANGVVSTRHRVKAAVCQYWHHKKKNRR